MVLAQSERIQRNIHPGGLVNNHSRKKKIEVRFPLTSV